MKGLFIDFDGTLVESLPYLKTAYYDFLHVYGISGSESEFELLNGPTLYEVVSYLKNKYQIRTEKQELYDKYTQRLFFLYSQEMQPLPDIRETLVEVKIKGWKITLVTSNRSEWVDPFLKRNNLSFFFDHKVFCKEGESGKPSPAVYLRALNETGIQAQDAMAIEDAASGVQAALSAGITPIWLGKTTPIANEKWIPAPDWLHIQQTLKEK